MGRSRQNGAIVYDLTVTQDAFDAIQALAEERGIEPEEVVREQLLNDPSYKARLVPAARQKVRHATINLLVADAAE